MFRCFLLVPINQYHQHGQGNLAPTPSPLSHGGINPINSPGPVEYISATRTGAGAGHDYAVYSNSVQGFGNGMVSLRFLIQNLFFFIILLRRVAFSVLNLVFRGPSLRCWDIIMRHEIPGLPKKCSRLESHQNTIIRPIIKCPFRSPLSRRWIFVFFT